MGWILLAAAGQFLNAIVAIFDKYIVSDEQVLPRPFVYAFYSCLVTGGWIIIFFLGWVPGLSDLGMPSLENVKTPTIQVVGMSILAAYTFFIALVSMYDALRRADASNALPIIGSVSALATFGFSYLFLDATLHDNFIIGIVLLAVGTLLVAQTLPRVDTVLQVLHSGLFFALHYITMKGLFLETSFDDGFFWSRVGFVFFTLSLLLIPAYFEKVKTVSKRTTRKAGIIVLLAKILAGVASFLLLKATHLGEPAVVQALGGLQYVFILLISIALAHQLPSTATDRDTRPETFFRRLLYVVIILVGFVVLFT
ncbi:MAG: EamA family transporter [Candidatus Kaiserbacteria bacterium]|nr:EamA family transporter [Candidatus Kaiserbacteria bacterium]MCB9815871.1 EamA family transporter [Candidatus Nomurabacteria bacterium]